MEIQPQDIVPMTICMTVVALLGMVVAAIGIYGLIKIANGEMP